MATLSKFGVPMGNGGGRGGILQPKYVYRYRVRFVNFGPIAGGTDLTQQVVSMVRPKVSHEPVTVDSYNSKAYFAARHTWDEVTVTFRDDVTNAVARLVGHQTQKQLNHFEQTGALAGSNYKFTTYIETMDGADGVLDQWILEGCYLSNVDWGESNYSTSESQQITCTIRYDNATMSDGLFEKIPQLLSGFMV